MDYYHREGAANLLWSIIAGVQSSKQTDLCHAVPEEATWLSSERAHVLWDEMLC